jgi:hypothetical protein
VSYLVFVTKPTGYELHEREGDPPKQGETLELDGRRYVVAKLAGSPLPGDARRCVYLLA